MSKLEGVESLKEVGEVEGGGEFKEGGELEGVEGACGGGGA